MISLIIVKTYTNGSLHTHGFVDIILSYCIYYLIVYQKLKLINKLNTLSLFFDIINIYIEKYILP